jgi:hypothetical protein
MPKQAGLGDQLYVAGVDVSGDIGSIGSIGGGNSPLEVTAIDKSGYERLGGKRDGSLEFTAFYNTDPGQEHAVFSLLPTADQVVSYFRGTFQGGQAASLVGKQINYDPTRGEDGSLTFKVNALANGFGLEWGRQLTPGKRTDSGAANGAGEDYGASSAFGLQAYLQVFAFAGTSVTVKLQHSNDDGGGDPYADVTGGAFTAVTVAPASQRIATSGVLTIKRWLRVVTTGTFSNAVFAVMAARNLTSTVF